MKVLYVVTDYPPHDTGAPGSMSREITRCLAARGVEVHVLSPGPRTETTRESDRCRVHWLEIPRLRFAPALPLWVRSRTLLLRETARRIIRESGIDLVHSMDSAGYFIAGEKPTVAYLMHPVIYDSIHTHSPTQKLYIRLFCAPQERRLVERSAAIVADGSYVRELFARQYPPEAGSIGNIPLGIDTETFRPHSGLTVRQRHGIGPDELVVFHPGGARSERKGGLFLLDALNRLKGRCPVKCILTGDSREAGWKRRLLLPRLKELQLDNVILAGEVDRADLPLYYAAADIVVFPSTFEGGPLVPLEALACGKALVCSDLPGHRMLTDMQNALVVRAGDSAAIAGAIEKLAADPDLRLRLGAGGRRLITSEYSIDLTAERLLDVYEETLAKAGRTGSRSLRGVPMSEANRGDVAI